MDDLNGDGSGSKAIAIKALIESIIKIVFEEKKERTYSNTTKQQQKNTKLKKNFYIFNDFLLL